jgi:hypothetical protein
MEDVIERIMPLNFQGLTDWIWQGPSVGLTLIFIQRAKFLLSTPLG